MFFFGYMDIWSAAFVAALVFLLGNIEKPKAATNAALHISI